MPELKETSDYGSSGGAATAVLEQPAVRGDVTRLAAGAGVALVGKVLGRGLQLVVDVTLARVLGPLSYGLYAIGWTTERIVTFVLPLGVDAGVIRFGSKFWRKDDSGLKGVIFESLGIATISGLLIGALFFFTAQWWGTTVFHKPELGPVIRWFAFIFPLAGMVRLTAASTRISQRMKYAVFTEDVIPPATNLILLSFLFYFLGHRITAALTSILCSFVIASLFGLKFVKQLFPEIFAPAVKPAYMGKELLAFSLPTVLTGAFGVLLIWVDRLLVGYFLPAADVGVYQAVSQLALGLAIVLGGFNAIFSPMTADLHHRGEMKRLEELFRVSTKWGLYLTTPLFLVTCFGSKEVMAALFGAPYVFGWSALTILTFAQVANAGTGPVGFLLVMTGRQNTMFKITASMFAMSVVLGIVLIPRWGIAGAAVATASAVSGMFILATYFVWRAFGMRPHDKRYLKGLLATVLAAGGLFLIRQLGIGSPMINVVLDLIAATGIFAGTLMLCGLDTEDRDFIHLLLSRVRSR